MPVTYLYGIDSVLESLENYIVSGFIREFIFEEVYPTLHLVEAELNQFANDVLIDLETLTWNILLLIFHFFFVYLAAQHI